MSEILEKAISELRKLKRGKNLIEIKRIDIAIALRQGKKYRVIKKELNCGQSTISYVVKTFKKSKFFYKTNYKGAKERYTKDVDDIKILINEGKKENKGFDIREMVEKMGLEKSIKSYNKIWYLTRRKIHMPYQKPYVIDKKSPDDADEIFKKKYRGKLLLK